MNLDRRKFLSTSTLAAGASCIPFTAKKVIDKLGLAGEGGYFVTHSGQMKYDDSVVIGFLASLDAEKDEDILRQIRETTKFTAELKYTSTSKYKPELAKMYIDYFMESRLRLIIQPLANSRELYRGISWKDFQIEKTKLYGQIADYDKTITNITVKSQSVFGPSDVFKNGVKSMIGREYNAVNSKDSNLLQFSDLLTGSVRADMNGNLESAVKRDILKYFKTSLRTQSFRFGNNYSDKVIIL